MTLTLRPSLGIVKAISQAMSTVFRNVPMFRSLEVSPFVFLASQLFSMASGGAEPCEPKASV